MSRIRAKAAVSRSSVPSAMRSAARRLTMLSRSPSKYWLSLPLMTAGTYSAALCPLKALRSAIAPRIKLMEVSRSPSLFMCRDAATSFHSARSVGRFSAAAMESTRFTSTVAESSEICP